jgi:pimeloyl-ACP methyl ester carboxylesterase
MGVSLFFAGRRKTNYAMVRSKPRQHQTKISPQPARPRNAPTPPPTVSGKWLLAAVAVAISAAAFCGWAVLCLLFWQGSWQLLYHPAATVVRTPATVGLAFQPVSFAVTDTGTPQLQGWWIAANPSEGQYTVLYLHGQNGNLGDTLDDLANLHSAGVNILAFDYRGFGQSLFVHPSEGRLRQDAAWALSYLTATRHIDTHSIIVDGSALGANLALEVAAAHPDLSGVVLESPLASPTSAIFDDPRAHLVPAHLLVSDRFDLKPAAAALRIPSLWIFPSSAARPAASEIEQAFQSIGAPKMRVTLAASSDSQKDFVDALKRWLGDLKQ